MSDRPGGESVRWEDFLAAPGGALTTGNHASLVTSERTLLRQLRRIVRRARRTLDVRFYRIHDDETGRDFVQSLMTAQARGVMVRVLLDGFGGQEAGSLPQELAAAGCQVQLFNALDGPPQLRQVVRDHGKVVIGDAQLAWVASANVGDDYARIWHDAGVVVRGVVVGELLRDFEEVWDGVAAGVIPARASVAVQQPAKGRAGRLPMRVVANGYDGYATWPHIRTMLVSARSRVLVTHCYLTDERVVALLAARARDGLKVVVVAPDRSDVGVVDWVMRRDVRALLDAGVRYYHLPGMSHRKALIVDDRWVLLGSANLDALSLDVNLEVGLAIFSRTLGRLATARLVATEVARAKRVRVAPLHGWRRLVAWVLERFRDFL